MYKPHSCSCIWMGSRACSPVILISLAAHFRREPHFIFLNLPRLIWSSKCGLEGLQFWQQLTACLKGRTLGPTCGSWVRILSIVLSLLIYVQSLKSEKALAWSTGRGQVQARPERTKEKDGLI